MKKFLVLAATVFGFSSFAFANAELYFVEPMVCSGKINKLPDHMHSSYTYASLHIVSFWSVRKKNCSLAPSSSTSTDYAEVESDLNLNKDVEIGGWLDVPVKVDGVKVTIPNGPWGGAMDLEIVETRLTDDGQREDVLKGRYQYAEDTYYDMVCTASVVENPNHIQNDTINCN